MPLPYNEWLEVIQGPSTWKLIKALFREDDLDSDRLCTFTIIERGHGRPKKFKFRVTVRDVRRLQGGKFRIGGWIHELDSQTWEPLADMFVSHYNPETRQGSFKIEALAND